ncbi:uncharacterized protein FFNC_15664 [Fusarium fujikuroi]|nr:uncharacterized protein FFNC_15664 [Fusarium fujikuroi]
MWLISKRSRQFLTF